MKLLSYASLVTSFPSFSSVERMQCIFNGVPDDPWVKIFNKSFVYHKLLNRSTCLLGGKKTSCEVYKCLVTVGKSCSLDAKISGKECGKGLMCGKRAANSLFNPTRIWTIFSTGCDNKCNGCMTVNGIDKCHFSHCMPKEMMFKKRSQFQPFPIEVPEDNLEYPLDAVLDV